MQPNYNSATLFNDVALLVLEHPFQADDNVQLICLPPQGATFTDRNCYAIGWGKSNFDSDSYQVILKKVQLPMVSHPDCQTALRGTRLKGNYRLHNSFVCAGGEAGIDTCTGDGGSPLMCPFSGSETRFYQAGIVSWGIGCGTAGVPGVYAKNSMFTEWINQELQKHRVDGDLFDWAEVIDVEDSCFSFAKHANEIELFFSVSQMAIWTTKCTTYWKIVLVAIYEFWWQPEPNKDLNYVTNRQVLCFVVSTT